LTIFILLRSHPSHSCLHDMPSALPLVARPNLTSEGSRPRVDIAGRNRVVDVDQNSWVASLVGTREGYQVGSRLGAASSDLELGTAKVELRSTGALGDVETNVLVAHEVLSWGNAGRDLDVVVCGACIFVSLPRSRTCMRRILTQPGQRRSELGLLGVDAEPGSPSGVPLVDILAFGNLGKVGLEGAGMVGVRVDVDLDTRSGCDRHGLVAGVELVATDVTARHVGDGTVVLPVLGLTHSTPCRGTVNGG
jgi:hypothetical protein